MQRREFITTAAALATFGFSSRQVRTGQNESCESIGGNRPLLEPVHQSIVCPWSASHPRHDHQLIFPLDENRLMLVWCEYYADRPSLLSREPTSRGGQARDDMPCRISAKLSTDRGRSWSGTITLQENRWKRNVKHPNLVRLSEKEILFTFVGWESATRRNVFLRRSLDNGETWNAPVQISEPGWYCNNADRAVRLRSGRVLLPAHGPYAEKYIGAAPYRGAKSRLHSFVFYSDDGFETWKRSTNSMTAPGRGCHEPTIVELADGRLMCFLRNSNRCIYRSVSQDGGVHWSPPEATELPAPESPALLKRIPSTGDLLLLWNNVASSSNWPRTPLTAAISRDEGQTWESVRDVDCRPGRDAAYASVTFVEDEALVAYYTRPRHWARDAEIMLKVYNIDRFYG